MSEQRYRTSFIRDLALRDVNIFEQLLLLARNEPQFTGNVSRLQKPALEATVCMLVLKLQKNSNVAGLEVNWVVGLENVLGLIEQNHLYLQKDEECLGLLLNVLGLTVMLEEDIASCARKVEMFVEKFQTEYHELPLFYEVLRTLLIVSLEKDQLQKAFLQMDVSELVRNLYSDSHQIRMKSLACLQLLIYFRSDVIDDWHRAIQEGERKISEEHRSFMLCHLVETVVQRKDMKGSFLKIVESIETWKLIQSNCESDDQLVRKEGLSVIKNILAYLKEAIKESIANDLFEWTAKDVKKLTEAWQCFVTILETLNESQTHLIMPALPLIEKLSSLSAAWKNSIFKLILRHENLAVSGWGIDYLLEKSKFDGNRQQLEVIFLAALNRTAVFQNFDRIKRLLVDYYSEEGGASFLMNHLKDIGWGSVPFTCMLEAVDQLLDSTTHVPCLQESVNNLTEQCLTIKNINLRCLASLQLSQMLLKLALREDLSAQISLDRTVLQMNALSKVTQRSFAELEDWNRVQQLIDGSCFERMLTRVKPSDDNIIKDVFVPYMQNDRTSTERRLKQTFDRDLLLAVRILHYGKLPFVEAELKIKLDNLVKHFSEDCEINLKSLEIFKEVGKNCQLIPLMEDIIQKLIHILHRRLNRLNYESPAIAVTVQLVHLFSRLHRVDMVDQFFTTFMLDELVKTIQLRNSDKSLYGSVFAALSDVFLFRLKSDSDNGAVKKQIILDYSKLIDVGDVHVLFNTLEILSFIFGKKVQDLNDDSDFHTLSLIVNRCYKEILIYRKSDHFLKVMNKFIATLLAPWSGEANSSDESNRWLKEVVTDYFTAFLEQAVVIGGLANMLFEKMLLLPIETLLDWNAFGKLLLSGLLFGDGQKREQRIEDEACVASKFYGTSLFNPPTQLQSDARVRILCGLFLYRLAKTNHPDATLFLLKLERMLIEKFQQITKSKERYYADSQTHRHKLRIMQALCVVFKLTGTKPYSLLEIVLYETNQPNINYLIELILADSSIDTLTIINSLRNDRVKVSGVQSVFVILWLRCCKTNYLDVEYINFLLPWTMAQNFSTRLYAQITISKLLEKFYEKPNQTGCCPFTNIYCAINSYLKQGNVEKNLEKCMKDFRFNSIFDYDNLLTLENVYHNIPRVSGMAAEDVVATKILKECFEVLQLAEVNMGVAVEFDELVSERKENLFLSHGFGGSDHIQKKIVPLKCLEPGLEVLTNLPEQLRLKKKDNIEGLIIVASLVNRPPNLGGLARSSEIFAVKQYVVNSLKDLENKEFQALSMTAEKWLNVAELKSFQIVDYLLQMKAKGYSIVGAEQTTGSRPIQKITFPKRSILVLGHEKEGLPAHIISHLDIIAEIPQFGVVRSLNVHVTGAIFMWEYAKQHHVVDC
ncbi:probable methyltransferase TARBP1 [Ochlerotatus camptorhynchus]|uniref:probable methyltransferase TARBP1 n=1 Tax=Ochlerotatus camptorhynchus TaxID=644619 RepID=UPI0031E25621